MESTFIELATGLIGEHKARRFVDNCKANAAGYFLAETATGYFGSKEFDNFMLLDDSDWRHDDYRFVQAFESEIVPTMKVLMSDHLEAQLSAATDVLACFE